MKIMITGLCGFVMSMLAKEILTKYAQAEIVGIDIAGPDETAARLFADHRHRLTLLQADITDAQAINTLFDQVKPDYLIHGATVTHVDAWEREQPGRFITVNTLGTLNLLQAAVACRSVKKALYISSAAVYGGRGPETPEGLQPESGPFYPDELYGISKFAAEQICQRFMQLHGLPVAIVRMTKVFGAMERPTSARASMSIPYRLMQAALRQKPVTISQRSAHALSDWISVDDVARALVRLFPVEAPTGVYNMASGQGTPLSTLVAQFPVEIRWTGEGEADIDSDPNERYGKNGCYDIGRLTSAIDWRPQPVEEQCAQYIQWARENPAAFISADEKQRSQ